LRDEEKRKSRNFATCIGMSKGLDQPDQKGRQILRITHPIPLILQEIAEVQQLRRHGDMFERLVGGFYKAHGRADDTMNLGGIKTSAVEIERVCNKAHEAVLETAAIGVQGPNGGPDQLVIAAVLKKGNQIGLDELQKIFSLAVSSKLNPLFKVSAVAVVPEFPRTASNKVMRWVLRSQFTKKIKGISLASDCFRKLGRKLSSLMLRKNEYSNSCSNICQILILAYRECFQSRLLEH
jgi:hypothetical protein